MPDKSSMVHTFSICAYDTEQHMAAVAVSTCTFSVGAVVPHVEPGVGAVATQAYGEYGHGPRALEWLRKEIGPEETMRRLLEKDFIILGDSEEDRKRREAFETSCGMTEEGLDYWNDAASGQTVFAAHRVRQVGMVDRQGRAAAHTGARCTQWAGHRIGDGYACQGNMLTGADVIDAMAETFENKRGAGVDFIERMYRALEAGQAAGGDKRGRQSAAIVAAADRGHLSTYNHVVDFRVDDHEDPVAELGRILRKAERIT